MAESLRELDLPLEVLDAITNQVDSIVAAVIYALEEGKPTDFEECYELIDDTYDDETAAIGLCLDHRLEVVEALGEDHGLEPIPVGEIRSMLESFAGYLICSEARSLARSLFEEFEEFMGDHDLEFQDLASSDRGLGHFRHFGERYHESCTVYEHRNADGDLHLDLWCYSFELDYGARARSVGELYVHQSIDADDLTAAELAHDAS